MSRGRSSRPSSPAATNVASLARDWTDRWTRRRTEAAQEARAALADGIRQMLHARLVNLRLELTANPLENEAPLDDLGMCARLIAELKGTNPRDWFRERSDLLGMFEGAREEMHLIEEVLDDWAEEHRQGGWVSERDEWSRRDWEAFADEFEGLRAALLDDTLQGQDLAAPSLAKAVSVAEWEWASELWRLEPGEVILQVARNLGREEMVADCADADLSRWARALCADRAMRGGIQWEATNSTAGLDPWQVLRELGPQVATALDIARGVYPLSPSSVVNGSELAGFYRSSLRTLEDVRVAVRDWARVAAEKARESGAPMALTLQVDEGVDLEELARAEHLAGRPHERGVHVEGSICQRWDIDGARVQVVLLPNDLDGSDLPALEDLRDEEGAWTPIASASALYGGPAVCRHRRVRWHTNVSRDAALASCETCGGRNVEVHPAHQLSEFLRVEFRLVDIDETYRRRHDAYEQWFGRAPRHTLAQLQNPEVVVKELPNVRDLGISGLVSSAGENFADLMFE